MLNAGNDELQQETRVGAERIGDSEWLRPRKKIRLTYSQKRPCRDLDEPFAVAKNSKGSSTAKCLRKNERGNPSPGGIVAATPLLRRARGHIVPSPAVARKPVEVSEQPRIRQPQLKRGTAKQKELDQRLANLRAQSASNRHSDLEAIYRSLEALLKATRRQNTTQQRGPRSFLDMCLRKVPQYIEALDAQERWDAEENGTISTLDDVHTSAQIYDYLDSIGPVQGRGWVHLRTVVRADGLQAVKQGIVEGLFGDDFSELLIDLCVQAGALSEAEELVSVLSDRRYPQPTSPDSSFAELPSLRPLSVLWTFANKFSRTSFLLRQCSLLLSNGNLPQDWLATREFERIWTLAVRKLSVPEAADDAVTFMSHSIQLLCRRKQTTSDELETVRLENDISTANRQTLTSALTMLAAMSLLGEIELQSAHVSESEIMKICLIGDRLRYILRSCLTDLELPRSERWNQGDDLLRMALFLSSGSARNDEDFASRLRNGIEQAWRQNTGPSSARKSRAKHCLDEMASFVSSVARSCARGLSLASHVCLDTIFEQLECLALDKEILDSMKAVAAFSLAQQTNNVKDFIYAERLASSQSSSTRDERSRSLFTGYRWEETIGEWVTVSPVVDRRRSRTRARQSGSPLRVLDVDHNENDAQVVVNTSRGSIYGGADSVTDLELEQERSVCKDQASLALGPGRVNTKKRAHSCTKVDRPRGVTVLRPNRDVTLQLTKPVDLLLDDELGSDKENRSQVVGQKPRRSLDRRALLNSKPRSSLLSRGNSSMIGDDYSDDELCM